MAESRAGALVSAMVCVLGCGSSPAVPGDADAGTAAAAVDPPRIAWLDAREPPVARPSLVCPPGWRIVSLIDGVAACDPWAESGRATCTARDEAHFPGEPGCTRVGPACPAGDWAEDLPAGRPMVFVKAGAPAGGDGTRALPFSTISAARTGAAAGTVIALGKGRYDESVALGTGMTLWGACVAETVLTSSSAAVDAGVVSASGAGAEVRNVLIDRPSRLGVLAVGASRSIRLESVVIDGAVYAGVGADAAQLDATDLVVRGTRPNGAEGGFGLALLDGATSTIARASFEGCTTVTVLVDGVSSTLSLEDAAVVRTRSITGQADALVAQTGATLHATRVVAEDNVGAGFSTTTSAGNLRLADVVVRRNEQPGIAVIPGTLEANAVWCDQNGGVGVLVQGDSTAMLADVVVSRTSAIACSGGHGVQVDMGAELVAARVAIGQSESAAIVVDDDTTTAIVADLVVSDTHSGCGGGQAVQIAAGASASIERALVSRSEYVAIVVGNPGTRLDLRDVAVHDTSPGTSAMDRGWAIHAGDGAALAIDGALVEGARDCGVVVTDVDTTADLADFVVRDVAGAALTGDRGRGWQAQMGAHVTARRVVVERVRQFGVVVGSGAVVTLGDAVVTNVLAAECGATTCSDAAGGTGIVVDRAGSIATVARFRVLDAALCGAQIAAGGSLDLADGEIARVGIGACVAAEDYDLSRLTRTVTYHDNGVNLQATTLPLPDSYDALMP